MLLFVVDALIPLHLSIYSVLFFLTTHVFNLFFFLHVLNMYCTIETMHFLGEKLHIFIEYILAICTFQQIKMCIFQYVCSLCVEANLLKKKKKCGAQQCPRLNEVEEKKNK